jgi:hypothetical protein
MRALPSRTVLAVVTGVLPTTAFAGSRLELRPSLSVGQDWDDNLFWSPDDPQADAITSVAPGLLAALRSPRLDASLSYSQEGEIFAQQSSLSTADAGRSAVAALRYTGRRGFVLETTQAYTTTRTAGELVPTTGLDLGRRNPASQVSSTESLSFLLGPRNRGTVRHEFARDTIEGGVTGHTHSATLTFERKRSERAALSLSYTLRRFGSEGGATTSHVVLAGWSRALGPRTSISLAAGPRLTAGIREPEPEGELTLRQRFKGGEVSAAYFRGQARILGQPGVGSTESATLNLARSLSRDLRIAVSPGLFRNRVPQAHFTVGRVATELAWSIGRSVSIVGSHVVAATRGSLQDVLHNVFSVRVSVAAPGRPLASPPRDGGAGEEP